MTTNKGELSVKVDAVELLAKALRPLPDKWKGLSDVDTRYRQRYVDLIVNEDARRAFEVRHAVIASIRRSLADRGFVEVETPVLHVEAGGAHARPFVTHHNALDMDLYLRIALELHLKRLIVGGLERVFEIGRVFRNEGIAPKYNPEFTMLEVYQAFADYTDMMDAHRGARSSQAARDALGTTVDRDRRRARSTWPSPWRRARLLDLVAEAVGRPVHPSMTGRGAAARSATTTASPTSPTWAPGQALHGALRRPRRAHARSRRRSSPTTRARSRRWPAPTAHDPDLVERFELVGGRPRAGQRLQRAERPRRPAPAVRGRAAGQGGRRPRGRLRRRGLPPGARVRHAADRRARHRHRPAGDAADRRDVDQGGHPLPDAAARRRLSRGRYSPKTDAEGVADLAEGGAARPGPPASAASRFWVPRAAAAHVVERRRRRRLVARRRGTACTRSIWRALQRAGRSGTPRARRSPSTVNRFTPTMTRSPSSIDFVYS